MTRFSPHILLCSAAAALALGACASDNNTANPMTVERPIMTATGTQLGTVTLKDLGKGGTEVTVNVSGVMSGDGVHAMHFHEFGKCDAPDFKSAGGHYNPTGAAHGMNMDGGPHAGDMMNIDIAETNGTLTVINERVSINGDHGLPALFDADGTALIIHEKADDYMSQPTGAAGGRMGCALITP